MNTITKAVAQVTPWLMRITFAIFVYNAFFNTLLNFNLNSLGYWFNVGYVFSALLLLIGGFKFKIKWDIIAGCLILAITTAIFFINGYTFGTLESRLFRITVAAYFIAR